MFEFQMDDDEHKAMFTFDPEFPKPMETEGGKATLREFLHYLEKNGKVMVDLECHSIKRIKPKGKDDLSTYEISQTEKCGFRPKSGAGPKAILGAVTPTTMKDCKHAGFVLSLRYMGAENQAAPGKPKLLLKKNVKVLANTIVKF